MAPEKLAMIQKEAGAEYLTALQRLGLDPDCLFWAEDEIIALPILVLVTRQIDYVGPLALSRSLFKAYNAAATPREIDPFVLRLHSPEQLLIRELNRIVETKPKFELQLANGSQSSLSAQALDTELLAFGGLSFERDWIYKWKIGVKRQSSLYMLRKWHVFSDNVDRLAA